MNAPAREEFLLRRRSGIGGSDISAILGLNPYKTPFQLWLDKTGRSEDEQRDPDAIERMHFGNVLESVVAAEYSARTGHKVQRINQQLQHPSLEIAVANIDRAVIEPGKRARWDDAAGRVLGATHILECKTAHAMARHSPEWGEAGSDEVPQSYWLQCMWYLGITGLPRADLAVLFGGQKFVTYTIERDDGVIADLLTEADAWWRKHITADVPPDPHSEDEARQRWASHTASKELIVDATVADAVQQLAEVKATIDELKTQEQALRNTICTAIGDAESISYQGRKLATWKQNKPGSKTNWKAAADQIKGWMIDNDIEHGVEAVRGIIDDNTTETEGARVLRLIAPKEQ